MPVTNGSEGGTSTPITSNHDPNLPNPVDVTEIQVGVEKHTRLIEWAVHNGGYLDPKVAVVHHPEKGFHATVKQGKNIQNKTRIASCPMSATLSILNALNIQPFKCHGQQLPNKFLQEHWLSTDLLQSFFLMEQLVLGENSWWAPYIATLPTLDEVKEMQFELESDMLWIKGTNLESAVVSQSRKWLDQFETGMKQLKSLGWRHAIEGDYSWEKFRWAATIFATRSFTSQVLSDTAPADIARPMGRKDPDHHRLSKLFSGRFAVLLPVLDILNHKPGAQVEWQARVTFVGLQVLQDYQEEQELYNNYGPRDNEGLLLSYGFVLEDNPYDHMIINIRAPPGSPLQEARSWPKDERSNDNHNCYIFDMKHPIVNESSHLERAAFSYDLLESVSVLCANDRELQTMYQNRKTLMSTSLPTSFNDFRNLLATFSQIMLECKARAARLRSNDPSILHPPLQPQLSKHRYAQIYRKKQLTILDTATSICAYILLHACTEQTPTDLLFTLQMKLPDHYSTALQSLAERLPCLTSSNELWTPFGLLEHLPSPTSAALRICLECIITNFCELKNDDQTSTELTKVKFAIILSAICSEAQTGTQFSPRIKTWIENITTYYPPEDENWSYVPHEGPWEAHEAPPLALMNLLKISTKASPAFGINTSTQQWLQPKMICWGWNVMEEEGVRVPSEIERLVSKEGDLKGGSTEYLIYCRHGSEESDTS